MTRPARPPAMRRLTDQRIILVTRPTRLTELKQRFVTSHQARFYVRHLGQDFSDYEHEDARYAQAVADARQTLARLGNVQLVDRTFLPNFVFAPDDTVVVLGQDGLVANTVKYLDGQPVVGVNPEPGRWDGTLLPFTAPDLEHVMPEVLARRRPTRPVTMARATLNTGGTMHAVNDLFIGARTHVSARYAIATGGRAERHSSSGVIVSTGLGSTGWLRSLLTGAAAIMAAARGLPPPGTPDKPAAADPAPRGFPWDAPYLVFTVREPFPSCTTQAGIVSGRVTAHQPLTLVSLMPENGVIFSDGIEQDFLEFRSGTQATITPADRQGRLVV